MICTMIHEPANQKKCVIFVPVMKYVDQNQATKHVLLQLEICNLIQRLMLLYVLQIYIILCWFSTQNVPIESSWTLKLSCSNDDYLQCSAQSAPLVRIFSGWQIKNPFDGPAARLFFRWINDDDICIRLLMSDNEIIICQLISRCAVHACNVSFHWFLRLNLKRCQYV